MDMISLINLALLIAAALLVAAALTSLLSQRLGAPLLLLFLGLGLAVGIDGLGIDFDNAPLAYFVGSGALAIILFDAGFETPWRSFRLAAGPGLMLATLGVLLTTSLVAAAAVWWLGLDWITALMLGAIVSSTDAAAVLLLLRLGGITIRDRVRSTLEIESGCNDPIAVFLVVGLAAVASASDGGDLWQLLPRVALELGGGAVAGFLAGHGIVRLINRLKLDEGLYPLVVMGLALATFAAVNSLHASGFLAAYVAGLVAGNHRLHAAAPIRRFQAGMAWLCQIVMFLTLGLLATPSGFAEVLIPAAGLATVLILLARPLAAWLCLLPFGFGRREMAFVAWVGLRGAVSILLAIVPALAGHPQAEMLFNIAFLVVLISLVVQGWTLKPVARALRQLIPRAQGPLDRIELSLPGEAQLELVAYSVHSESPVARGQTLPRWARPALVRRPGEAEPLAPDSPLKADDHVFLFAEAARVPLLDRLFAGTLELSPEDREFFGDFQIAATTPLSRLALEYDLAVPTDKRGLTAADLFAKAFGEAEVGDRLRLGAIEVVVVTLEGGRAQQVGLVLAPTHQPGLRLPLFLTRRELGVLWRRWRRRRRKASRVAPPNNNKEN